MEKMMLKKVLEEKTGCVVQHDGWTCGTCFFAISKKFNNQDWQTLLVFRGDYKKEDMENLPKDTEKSLDKIYREATK